MKAPAKPGGHLEQTFPKMSSAGTQWPPPRPWTLLATESGVPSLRKRGFLGET